MLHPIIRIVEDTLRSSPSYRAGNQGKNHGSFILIQQILHNKKAPQKGSFCFMVRWQVKVKKQVNTGLYLSSILSAN